MGVAPTFISRESAGRTVDDILCSLVKVGERRHIKRFFEKGEMFCQTIDYFARLEADAERSDRDEGLGRTYGLHTLRSVMVNNIEILPGMTGGLDIRWNAQQGLNIFCMTAIRDFGSVRIDRRCSGFGDSFLLLARPALFVRMVEAAAKRSGHHVVTSPVEYVSKGGYTGDMGPFKKFDRLSYQDEVRFVFAPGIGGPLRLRLGPLNGVAIWGDLKNLPKVSIEPGPG